jgi:hypothetical protein
MHQPRTIYGTGAVATISYTSAMSQVEDDLMHGSRLDSLPSTREPSAINLCTELAYACWLTLCDAVLSRCLTSSVIDSLHERDRCCLVQLL